jgi:hypothetical protein
LREHTVDSGRNYNCGERAEQHEAEKQAVLVPYERHKRKGFVFVFIFARKRIPAQRAFFKSARNRHAAFFAEFHSLYSVLS